VIFFDTSYLVRLYLEENGSDVVRHLAAQDDIASSWHAQPELLCSLHRAYREQRLTQEELKAQQMQFATDQNAGAYTWLALRESILSRLQSVIANLEVTTFLRAADALHLACAAEHGFTEVYSNDRHFLAAAPLFGLKGINVLENSKA
jgi:predicted nucleic acid-binding protein